MSPAATTPPATCPTCGYAGSESDLACSLCGRLLRPRAPGRPSPPEPAPSAQWRATPEWPDRPAETAERTPRARALAERVPQQALFLLAGAALAPALAATPLLRYAGWFLASLAHEMGHSLAAWLVGCPAFPAIRLDGHAAALHGEQSAKLAILLWLALAWGAWALRRHRALALACGAAVLLYPAVAFTGAKELLFLASGHLGELAFAAICFWRALSEGFTQMRSERAAYAMLGWYLLGRNLSLHLGLVFSTERRAWYEGSGSFGMTNDLIRIAEEVVGCRLESVGLAMALASLAVLPLAWLVWRWKPD